MGIEHERKFEVTGSRWRDSAVSRTEIWQGWIFAGAGAEVRVRITNGAVHVACKIGLGGDGSRRVELEERVDAEHAEHLRSLCATSLKKTRWLVNDGGRVWEVDEYGGALAGLVVAELENPSGDDLIPDWVGREVTGMAAWSNRELARNGGVRETS